MKLLAIDTTTSLCSLALKCGDEITVSQNKSVRTHATSILPAIQTLLKKANLSLDGLDGIVFTRGPGSFTGVRLSAGLAQGLAYSTDLPLVSISSLALLAETAHVAHGFENVAVAIDAHMGEAYFAAYSFLSKGIRKILSEDALIVPDNFHCQARESMLAVGNAWNVYNKLKVMSQDFSKVDTLLEPDVRLLLTLGEEAFLAGQQLAPFDIAPEYLRDKTAWKTLAQQQGTA